MRVEQLQLYNFRNFKHEGLIFSDSINLFIGNNAQGKTNLLESIYLLSTGKSHRGNKNSEMANFKETGYIVKARVNKIKEEEVVDSFVIGIGYDKETNKKKLKVNGADKKKLSEFIGNLNAVIFHPDDLQLIKGSPSNRRKFIDNEISQISPLYYSYLSDYNEILAQRNKSLKDSRYDKTQLELIPLLDIQLVDIGSKIIEKRRSIIEILKPLSSFIYKAISNSNEKFEMEYISFIEDLEIEDDLETIKERFLKTIEKRKKEELARGVSLVGIQKDDLSFKINDLEVKSFGSQGQQRTSVLSLKLSELELIKKEKGEYPILLLDDVFSELDKNRKTELVKIIKENKIQTFITETEMYDINELKDEKIFTIKNGGIVT